MTVRDWVANATVPVVLLSAAVLSVVAPPVVGIAAIAASNCPLLTASVLLTAVATLLIVLLPALIPSFVILGPVALPALSVKDRPEPFTTVVLPAASLDVKPLLLILVLPVVTEPLVPRSIFRANLTNSVSVPSETTPILPSVNTAPAAVFPLIFSVSSSLRVIVVPVSPSNLIPFVVTAVLAASAAVFTSNN